MESRSCLLLLTHCKNAMHFLFALFKALSTILPTSILSPSSCPQCEKSKSFFVILKLILPSFPVLKWPWSAPPFFFPLKKNSTHLFQFVTVSQALWLIADVISFSKKSPSPQKGIFQNKFLCSSHPHSLSPLYSHHYFLFQISRWYYKTCHFKFKIGLSSHDN